MKMVFILGIISTTLFSAPAFNKMRLFTNSDGSKFHARAQGDQYLHWLESEDGEILKYNPQHKVFEYAIIKNDSLQASGTRYQKNNSIRVRSIAHIKKLKRKDLYRLWQKKHQLAQHKERR